MNAYTTAYIINNFFYAYVLYRMFRIFMPIRGQRNQLNSLPIAFMQ